MHSMPSRLTFSEQKSKKIVSESENLHFYRIPFCTFDDSMDDCLHCLLYAVNIYFSYLLQKKVNLILLLLDLN